MPFTSYSGGKCVTLPLTISSHLLYLLLPDPSTCHLAIALEGISLSPQMVRILLNRFI